MEELLRQLGLSEKESKLYLLLLKEGVLAASHIAKKLSESRTNTYMILEKLTEESLVIIDDTTPVKRFLPADPLALQKRLLGQQQQIRQQQAVLNKTLPELTSMFNLGQHRPGVVYLEGIAGLRLLLEDNLRSQEEVCLIASDEAYDSAEAWGMLAKAAIKRKAKGIETRGLFHVPAAKWEKILKWQSKGYQIRRWGNQPLPGEIVIYGNKVAFTVYKPAIVVTIMTNKVMADTFKVLFEQLWQSALQE